MAIDREVVASAVVLREVHCALLQVIEGRGLSSETSPPTAAQLILPPESKASQAQWCDRTTTAIFRAQEAVEQDAWVTIKLIEDAQLFPHLFPHYAL